jgi:hypothetical protein
VFAVSQRNCRDAIAGFEVASTINPLESGAGELSEILTDSWGVLLQQGTSERFKRAFKSWMGVNLVDSDASELGKGS